MMSRGRTQPEARHLHLGFYEGGCDLEAIGMWDEAEGVWRVYFPFSEYGLEPPASQLGAEALAEFGTLLFVAKDKREATKRFARWAKESLAISLRG